MTVADRVRALLEVLPDGSAVTLPRATLELWADDSPALDVVRSENSDPVTWQEKLWTVPAETRIGVEEVAEALGRSADWVYRAISPTKASQRGRDPLPCKKLDGCLTFTAGAVRDWISRCEVVVNAEAAH